MREIKFRGLSANNEFVYGWLLQNVKPIGERSIIGTMEIHQPYGDWNKEFEVYDESVGQYTGLKDCNCVEIYEGDIVKCHGYIGIIMWSSEEPRFEVLPIGEDIGLALFTNDTFFEVIGNIHQNPELLERTHG